MLLKLLDDNAQVKRTFGAVIGFLFKSNGDIVITFKDFSCLDIPKKDFNAFIVEE